MQEPAAPERFCTVFDHRFLPVGMVLAESLREHCPDAELWVVCLDDLVEEQLEVLALPGVRTIRVRDIETSNLLVAKAQRSAAEYCWTLTPHLFDAVFDRCSDARRVTYLDTDLFFLDRPHVLLDQLDASGKHVLITDHGFAPEYAHGAIHGRYCVQFLTFRRGGPAILVRRAWQQQCLDWCYARLEDGKFGDQKYLDDWPQRYGSVVHVFEQPERTLGPWNVSHVAERDRALRPVFFHFHGLRFISENRVRQYFGYRINAAAAHIYEQYVARLGAAIEHMHAAGIETPVLPQSGGLQWRLQAIWYRMSGRVSYANVAA
ncbi:MAG: glycosyl transferase [Phycisphaeraceae bacterium]|nr:glycosyl transferase [Phycisphaeraceae bacterium]